MSAPGGEKPYRLYRGGRTKGRVPTVGRPEKTRRERPDRDGRRRYRGPGPKPATRRRPAWRRALTPVKGSLLSDPSAILLLGPDHSLAASRAGDRHSDSITILRTGPDH